MYVNMRHRFSASRDRAETADKRLFKHLFDKESDEVNYDAVDLSQEEHRPPPPKIEGLPPRFYNKEGELDLRQVTGAEAFKLFQAQGMVFPIIRTG
jgi:hypothetical protein